MASREQGSASDALPEMLPRRCFCVGKDQATEKTVHYSNGEKEGGKKFQKHAVVAWLSESMFEANKTSVWSVHSEEQREGKEREKGLEGTGRGTRQLCGQAKHAGL